MVAPQAASPTRQTRPFDQVSTSARLMESKYGSGASCREASSRGTSQPRPSKASWIRRFCWSMSWRSYANSGAAKAKNAPAWAGSRWSAPTDASRPGTL
ncbi:hypothetical protein [Streptomyces niveus]|uniref:hypothetical protein n=1 Tax=Streptomyces niveus TaxID=193462 RepID=UPI000AA3B225|nr:hypothetical protein [Streptomyces niveus]